MNASIFSRRLVAVVLAVGYALWLAPLHAQEQQRQSAPAQQRTFSSPEEGVSALLQAAKAKDKTAVHEIFGPDAQALLTGDPVQDAANFEGFTRALAERCQPEREGDDKVVLDIGPQNRPFPIPLVKKVGRWFFDTAAGEEEIINRHIGRDELNAIGVCHAYVEAQRQYFNQNPDGSGIHKYAQKLKSTPGKEDGLYWPSNGTGEASPFGALVAEAHAEGYGHRANGSGPPGLFMDTSSESSPGKALPRREEK